MGTQLLNHALAHHVVGQARKGLDAHDIAHARSEQLCHLPREEPAFAVLVALRKEGLGQRGNLLNGHGRLKASAPAQRIDRRSARHSNSAHHQPRHSG